MCSGLWTTDLKTAVANVGTKIWDLCKKKKNTFSWILAIGWTRDSNLSLWFNKYLYSWVHCLTKDSNLRPWFKKYLHSWVFCITRDSNLRPWSKKYLHSWILWLTIGTQNWDLGSRNTSTLRYPHSWLFGWTRDSNWSLWLKKIIHFWVLGWTGHGDSNLRPWFKNIVHPEFLIESGTPAYLQKSLNFWVAVFWERKMLAFLISSNISITQKKTIFESLILLDMR